MSAAPPGDSARDAQWGNIKFTPLVSGAAS